MPRLLAMLCILAVFVPSFFMQGAARRAVRAAVAGRRLCDDRLVPPVEHVRAGASRLAAAGMRQHRRRTLGERWFDRLRERYERLARLARSRLRWVLVPAYLVVCGLVIVGRSAAAGPRDLSGRRRRRSSACGCGPPTARTSPRPSEIAKQALDIDRPGSRPGERRSDARLRRHDPLATFRSTPSISGRAGRRRRSSTSL